MRLLLIDGNSMIYRSYYGLAEANLSNSMGEPTGCVLAFMRTMISTIRVFDITHCVVAFDTKGKNTVRHQAYPEYKATRKPKKVNLSVDFRLTQEFLDEIKIKRFNNEKYEADDIVATLVDRFQDEAEMIIIMGGDKDYAQLVTNNVLLYMFSTSQKGFVTMGPTEVENKYGVPPNKIVDWLTMVGDTSDNLPGVPGVGEKGAPKLIEKYGGVKEFFNNLQDFPTERQRRLEHAMDDAKLTYKLATLIKKVPIEVENDDMLVQNMSIKGWKKMVERLELNSLKPEVKMLFKEIKEPAKTTQNFKKLIG